MKAFLFSLTFFAVVPLSHAAAPIHFEFQGEHIEIPTDGRTWSEGFRNDTGSKGIIEYVLPGEKVDNWSELVTINYFQGLEQNGIIERFLGFTKDGLHKQCADVKWEDLGKKDDGAIYAWTAKNCKGWSDQSEIARVINGTKGLYVVHYATKKVPVPQEKRAAWYSLFNKTKIGVSEP